MQVLVIGYVWPEPKSSAAGSHILSIMQSFKNAGWQVEFASPALPTEHMVCLESLGISKQTITLNCASFDEYIKTLQPDIVMFDRFMMEEQFGWRVDTFCPYALKILDTEDLQSLRQARHQAQKSGAPMSTADYHNELAKREIAAIYRCDLSLIISCHEMALLKTHYQVPNSLLHHLPFMLDTKQLVEQPTFAERQHFVTIGNFRHAPNWDSVLYLQQIWPLIRKQLPKAELHIYGSYPPPKATALSNAKTGFLVKGWADDAYEVIKHAKVMLSPLRFGAGIKGKFLDAMAVKTPSITTDIGIEGMFEAVKWPGAVANTPEEMAAQAVKMYQSEPDWLAASESCHTRIKAKFDQHQLAPQLIEKVTQIQNNLEQHRQNNFTGAMLKHHIHGSTKYMAQWIAAKNQNNNLKSDSTD